MLASTLQHLIQDKLVTVREVAELTGRGESTVYRWISGESQPDFEEVRLLTRRLKHAEARRRLAEMFTSGMPVTVEWRADVEDSAGEGQRESPAAALDAGLEALRDVADVLQREREMLRIGQVAESAAVRTIGSIDAAIRHLLVSKGILVRHRSRRRQARTTGP
jgi:transcriptional regulator with XRE-family HTH domain